jgi:hypothetical protein
MARTFDEPRWHSSQVQSGIDLHALRKATEDATNRHIDLFHQTFANNRRATTIQVISNLKSRLEITQLSKLVNLKLSGYFEIIFSFTLFSVSAFGYFF